MACSGYGSQGVGRLVSLTALPGDAATAATLSSWRDTGLPAPAPALPRPAPGPPAGAGPDLQPAPPAAGATPGLSVRQPPADSDQVRSRLPEQAPLPLNRPRCLNRLRFVNRTHCLPAPQPQSAAGSCDCGGQPNLPNTPATAPPLPHAGSLPPVPRAVAGDGTVLAHEIASQVCTKFFSVFRIF